MSVSALQRNSIFAVVARKLGISSNKKFIGHRFRRSFRISAIVFGKKTGFRVELRFQFPATRVLSFFFDLKSDRLDGLADVVH